MHCNDCIKQKCIKKQDCSKCIGIDTECNCNKFKDKKEVCDECEED